MSGPRKSLQIVWLKWSLAICRRKFGKRRRPGALPKKLAPFVEGLSPCGFQWSSSRFHGWIGYHPPAVRALSGEAMLTQTEWIWRIAFDVDPHAFGLQIFAYRFHATFTAETGSLETAKRRHIAGHAVTVDPHGAGFEPF